MSNTQLIQLSNRCTEVHDLIVSLYCLFLIDTFMVLCCIVGKMYIYSIRFTFSVDELICQLDNDRCLVFYWRFIVSRWCRTRIFFSFASEKHCNLNLRWKTGNVLLTDKSSDYSYLRTNYFVRTSFVAGLQWKRMDICLS